MDRISALSKVALVRFFAIRPSNNCATETPENVPKRRLHGTARNRIPAHELLHIVRCCVHIVAAHPLKRWSSSYLSPPKCFRHHGSCRRLTYLCPGSLGYRQLSSLCVQFWSKGLPFVVFNLARCSRAPSHKSNTGMVSGDASTIEARASTL